MSGGKGTLVSNVNGVKMSYYHKVKFLCVAHVAAPGPTPSQLPKEKNRCFILANRFTTVSRVAS